MGGKGHGGGGEEEGGVVPQPTSKSGSNGTAWMGKIRSYELYSKAAERIEKWVGQL